MTFDLNAYSLDSEGNYRDIDGNVIFFSFERFKDDICKKGHCFVCGAPPSRAFNNEHVFPDWLIRHSGIHDKELTLINGNRVKYSTYKIPCCQTCNSRLADVYETPISKVLCAGHDATRDYIVAGGRHKLCAWLSLVFLKVHLRDFKNNVSLDRRQDSGVIGDHYELSNLHHIHAVARSATVGIEVAEDVLGTLLLLQLDPSTMDDPFDYCDNLAGRTLLLQVNDLALIYVLDDCGATSTMLRERLKFLPNPLSEIQLREVYARHLAANIHIKDRPSFRTELLGTAGKPRITVQLPELDFHDYKPEIFGRMFAGALGNYSKVIMVNDKVGDDALKVIETGHASFLFDEHGNIRD